MATRAMRLIWGGDAIRFREAGYHILAPDARGLGESGRKLYRNGLARTPGRSGLGKTDYSGRWSRRGFCYTAFPWGGNCHDGVIERRPSDSGQGSRRRLWLYFRMGKNSRCRSVRFCHLPASISSIYGIGDHEREGPAMILRRPAPLRRWQDHRFRSCSFTEAEDLFVPI